MAKHPSTIPGFENANEQRVIEATGWPSESMAGQRIYRMRCLPCGHEYGANGCDIHERRCPSHQGGRHGERLREKQALSLFGAKSV